MLLYQSGLDIRLFIFRFCDDKKPWMLQFGQFFFLGYIIHYTDMVIHKVHKGHSGITSDSRLWTLGKK